MVHFTIGIAGHIDHGKTTLAHLLTGIDTDRLKEEKERSISIETGFAHFKLPNGEVVGVVDVPGHERFIRQMIAGSAGIDMVLLVIAANEGVMPQTREHLDILELLGVKKGIIVINKVDLVDEDMLSLVLDEINEITHNTFLTHAKTIPVSAKQATGIPELVQEITNTLATVPYRQSNEIFRMPIDRSFSVKGAGTVVTGTVFEGKVEIGDQLLLLPQNQKLRVRGLQVHHESVDVALAGQRTAINLTGVSNKQITRGDILVAPNFLEPSDRIDLHVTLLSSIDASLRHRSRIVAYAGTSEIEGIILLFDRQELLPGESTYAQLLTQQPLVVRAGDPILLRRPTPSLTLGGGRVVNVFGKKYPFRIDTVHYLQSVHELTVPERILSCVRHQEKKLLHIQNDLTVPIHSLMGYIDQLQKQQRVLVIAHDHDPLQHVVVHKTFFKESQLLFLEVLETYHRNHPMQRGMKRSECRASLETWSEELFQEIMDQLIKAGKLRMIDERLVLTDFLPQLPGHLAQKAEKILHQLEREGREVTDWSQIAGSLGLTPKQAEDIRRFYTEMEEVVSLTDKIVWTRMTWDQVIEQLRRKCSGTTVSLSDVKDALGLSRKYIIPILEKMDQLGITKREGEVRIWQK